MANTMTNLRDFDSTVWQDLKKLGFVPVNAVPHDVVVTDREREKNGRGDNWLCYQRMRDNILVRWKFTLSWCNAWMIISARLWDTFVAFMSDNGAEDDSLEALRCLGSRQIIFPIFNIWLTRHIGTYENFLEEYCTRKLPRMVWTTLGSGSYRPFKTI